MATYKASTTGATIPYGNFYEYHKPTIYQDTYSITRAFLRFNTSQITAALADIVSVKLKVKFTQIAFNPAEMYLRSAISTDDNWGTALTAALADFASTIAHLEDTVYVGSTGWKEFNIDKNNLNLS